MHNFYDIQQFLEKFGIYIYVGKRLWDIELSALEIDNLYKSGVIERELYLKMKVILLVEHRREIQYEQGQND